MKRTCRALLLLTLLLALSAASADPVLTSSGLTAWIGEENHMYLVDAQGAVKHLPAEILDLVAMDSQTVYCLTADHRVYSVYTDGSGSSIVYRDPTAEQLQSLLPEQVWHLQDGRLTATERSGSTRDISQSAVCAVEAGGLLYYVEQVNDLCLLKRALLDVPDSLPGLSTFPASLSVKTPVSLTASSSALALTHGDGSVTVIALSTGEKQELATVSADTKAAALVDDRLYRYSQDEAGWHLQQVDSVTFAQKAEAATSTPLPTATPAPTRAPTATPRPTVNRTPRPTATAEDENIRRGERSERVRKMQRRLRDLGYPVGSADGTYGKQTQMAVALFMSAVHAAERDYVSPSLLRKMNASTAPVYDQFMALQKGDRGMAVRLMQQALLKLGYQQLGQADGVYGQRTVDAVAAYMRSIGWFVPANMVMGETAPRELLMNLYLTPGVPVGPVSPSAPPSTIEQIINDLDSQMNPL